MASLYPEDKYPSVKDSNIPIKNAPAIAAGAFDNPPITAAINAFKPIMIPISYEAPEMGAITIPASAPRPALMDTAQNDIFWGLIPISLAAKRLTTQAVTAFPK